jgi:hypothetical protein
MEILDPINNLPEESNCLRARKTTSGAYILKKLAMLAVF